MYDKAISSYNNAPSSFTVEQKRRLQQNKLNLQGTIQSNLARAYKSKNPKINHFYDNVGYSGVPLWALFEILMMGDFGFLLSCLTYDMRDDVSKRIGLNLSADTDRQLIYKYIYTLKDLRNAIAHNSAIFDTRFRNIEPTRAMKRCLTQEIGLNYVNFKTIGDYIILMSYFLKLLGVTKTELKAFIRDYEKITDDYKRNVNQTVYSEVVHHDLPSRMAVLKAYL